MKIIALIPARHESKRIPHKNIQKLDSYPLIAYTIQAARMSGIFEEVIVSTEHEMSAKIAEQFGAKVIMRPREMALDHSIDYEWIKYTLDTLGKDYDCFAILRPTSPFRTKETIQRAWQEFQEKQPCDSLRAVERCKQHPFKMWLVEPDDDRMRSFSVLMGFGSEPYNRPYQTLQPIYVQNGCIEIAHCSVIGKYKNVSGRKIIPFFTEGYEGYDLNTLDDWRFAEYLINIFVAKLPKIPAEYRT